MAVTAISCGVCGTLHSNFVKGQPPCECNKCGTEFGKSKVVNGLLRYGYHNHPRLCQSLDKLSRQS